MLFFLFLLTGLSSFSVTTGRSTVMIEVKPIAGSFILGEGPHWDAKTKSLYFVDLDGKALCKYNATSGRVTKCKLDNKVSFVVPIEGKDGKFLLGYGGDFAVASWDGQSEKPEAVEIVAKVETSRENRLNDGKADPTGRVYGGSMCGLKKNGKWQRGKGTLYTLENGEAKVRLAKVGISNGLAWSLDHRTFYYIDSLLGNVQAFDFNKVTGDITNGKVIFDLKENNIPGLADGMTIDADGKLWVAIYGGARVIRIDPVEKKLLQVVHVPAAQTTSVAWGGDNLDELYVTSANVPDPSGKEEKHKHSYNGYLFKVTGLGVRGLPATNAKV